MLLMSEILRLPILSVAWPGEYDVGNKHETDGSNLRDWVESHD